MQNKQARKTCVGQLGAGVHCEARFEPVAQLAEDQDVALAARHRAASTAPHHTLRAVRARCGRWCARARAGGDTDKAVAADAATLAELNRTENKLAAYTTRAHGSAANVPGDTNTPLGLYQPSVGRSAPLPHRSYQPTRSRTEGCVPPWPYWVIETVRLYGK